MTTQNDLSWIIIRNGPGPNRNIVGTVRLLVTQEDLEQIVPALERLWRGKNNPNFSFRVEGK